jgi:hypothetical protein
MLDEKNVRGSVVEEGVIPGSINEHTVEGKVAPEEIQASAPRVFEGVHLREAFRRKVTGTVLGQTKTQTLNLDGIQAKVVLKDGCHFGKSGTLTAEPYAYFRGALKGGLTVRITGFAENAEKVKQAFLLARDGKIEWIEAIGSPLGRARGTGEPGMNVFEMSGKVVDSNDMLVIIEGEQTGVVAGKGDDVIF